MATKRPEFVARWGLASPDTGWATGWWHFITSRASSAFIAGARFTPSAGIQESRHFGGLRAGGWRVCAIRAGNGLDCGTRRGENPRWVSFERATLVEPLNTCLKAVVQCDPQPEDFVRSWGRGYRADVHHAGEPPGRPRRGHRYHRRAIAGGGQVRRRIHLGPRTTDVASEVKRLTGGRGADLVIVAVSAHGIVDQAMACSRPGSKILLFCPNFGYGTPSRPPGPTSV